MQQITTTQNSRQSPVIIAPTLKYCLYARKSTEAEDKQALVYRIAGKGDDGARHNGII